MPNSYKITSRAGVQFGTYEGETEGEALDALARDAGYLSQADAIERDIAAFDGTITRVDPIEGLIP